eukprot:gene36940-60965_t
MAAVYGNTETSIAALRSELAASRRDAKDGWAHWEATTKAYTRDVSELKAELESSRQQAQQNIQ